MTNNLDTIANTPEAGEARAKRKRRALKLQEIAAQNPQFLELHESAKKYVEKPSLWALRNGVLIAGYHVMLSIGTKCLLQCSDSVLLKGMAETPYEVAHSIFFMSAENREEAIAIADDPEETEKRIKLFVLELGERKLLNTYRIELYQYHLEINDCITDPAGRTGGTGATGSGTHERGDWWADTVDMILHEHGGDDEIIIWEKPLARIDKLCIAANARNKGETILPGRAPEIYKIADLMKQAVEEDDEWAEINGS